MKELWTRIDGWLGRHFPEGLERLPGGAAEDAVQRLQAEMGFELPQDLYRFLLHHDGTGDLALHAEGRWFLSTEEITEAWQELTDLWVDTDQDDFAVPAGPLRPRWWHRLWIPLATDGMGNYLCIDMDPLEGGTPGQVFRWRRDEGPTRVLYPSLTAMMAELADRLDNWS